ncbi:SAM-dependent DNA methyltransferase [Desulfovibrio sp. PG-178-WT-4]|uniref:site-specific DNA-methyltransferase (adenine-specific) n=1 Tax=Desulfovibrio porci TaxID=2605782 RepID=A0A6L5XKG1_9BACT|nr:type IIL restriction-modification enzyme MmeI [Desulfovibrio porci]MSS27579.1 SAM-dependent DNA methyltransferase [Desulfovibrio porci]
MKNLSKHAEWLSLIEISGPFLTMSMLDKAFPQGLEAVETPRRQKLRAAYEEWREAVDQEDKLLPELHREWVRLVLTDLLEYDHESLVHAGDWPSELPSVSSQEHAGTFKPNWIVCSPADLKPRLFIAVLPPDTDLESVQRGDGWPVSLQERMTLLCRTHGVRVGLLTDGERWMLVNAPVGSTSSQASWYARLWFQEPSTLRAFQSLLGVRRCFGPAEDTLESLLEESLKHHEEVTDTLGEQVRRAVEVLVQCLDKADEDRNRELLRDVKPAELYEAGLTVMMRLVFVLCAEERGLLLLGDSVYDRCYAVSTLRGQLAEEADRHGPEVLDRRHDAWARLLAVFRAVYGGIEHESLRMPALGGSLFDPDRFPFLEGRAKGTRWRETSAVPVPIDNRTVLLLLNSLQILEQPGGALLLSYRALDVEQIGHVYEGLLEHTVARVPRVTLGLQGAQKAKNPNIALAELESARLDDEAALVELLLEVTGRSGSAIRNGLSKPADDAVFGRLLGVCGGDTALAERIRPFTNLLRTDAWGDPIVYRDNSFMVTLGADRRETGTHYTPKALTESIVTTTLEPVVYLGPADGKPREEWMLKSSREILDLKICDPAMGSGAFLVQACRYLGEKLVEAWLHEEEAGKAITVDGDVLDQLGAEEPLSSQLDERLTIARRLVAERCLYGVDINPLAVELAKLSIWLVTLAKGRPFGFLDHNLRSGDSLLGIHRLEQLTRLRMDTESGQQYQLHIFGQKVEAAVNEAIELRKQLRATAIRDIQDVEAMARLDSEARRKLESVELIADAMIGEALRCGGNTRALNTALDKLATMAGDFLGGNEKMGEQIARQAKENLAIDFPKETAPRRPFHWALIFPEVIRKGGFDGMVGNPPFTGGRLVGRRFGLAYQEYLNYIRNGVKGSPDFCAYFFLRVFSLLGSRGFFGLLATKSITETGSRVVCLDQIIGKGGAVYHSFSRMPWPGNAAVVISIAWVARDGWQGQKILDGRTVSAINGALEEDFQIERPMKLNALKGQFSQGQDVMGRGFELTAEDRAAILEADPKCAEVIFPLFNGQDLNTMPKLEPYRWVIYFRDWPEEKARQYGAAFRRVEELVKPYRDSLTGQIHQKCFWKFWDLRPILMQEMAAYEAVLASAIVTKYITFRKVPTNNIYNTKTKLYFLRRWDEFAVLQSTHHQEWAFWTCGTLGASTLNYSTSQALETWPMPILDGREELFTYGEIYHENREKIMLENMIGLTQFYNRFHDPSEVDLRIDEMRRLHCEIDLAVIRAYGWDDLDLEHDFHEVPYLPENDRVRFTISDRARLTVLRRLSELNHQRYEEEIAQGLQRGGKKRSTSRSPRTRRATDATVAQPHLDFDARVSAPTSENTPTIAIHGFLSTQDGWHAKVEILAATEVTNGQWNSAIEKLLADGLIERQGERRGAKYRAVKRN